MAAILLTCCLLLTNPARAAHSSRLSDITGTEWYAPEVLEMVNAGLITGFPDKTFKAAQSISSAEFTTIVARAVGAPTGAASGHWAGLTMETAKSTGWFSDSEIYPEVYESPVSRQQVAMILVNAFDGKLSKVTAVVPIIADKSTALSRFVPYVESSYQYGLFKGDDSGNFNPFSILSRAEAAALISRAITNMNNPPDASTDIYEMVKSSGLLTPTGERTSMVPADETIQGITVLRAPIGSGIQIKMNEVDGGYAPAARGLVKKLLAIAYPTSHEDAYHLTINTMLDRVFETRLPSWIGAGAIRYLDNRKLSTSLISSGNKETSIFIGDYGDYEDYKLNATKFSSFVGYSYRGGTLEESQRISEEQIVKYGITKEEMGKE